MTDPTPVKSVVIPDGFPVEVLKVAKKEDDGKQKITAQHSLAFQDRQQRNTAFIKKGLTKPGQVSYDTLRRSARSVHIVRICINALKQKITKTKWAIQNKDITKRKGKKDSRAKAIEDLLNTPNSNNESFRSLLDKMTEDLLVLDAVSIEKTRFKDGKLAELHFVDSATVRPVFDEHGNQEVLMKIKEGRDGETDTQPVSFVQVLNNSQYGGPESGDIVAAWSRDDFIHFHMSPQGDMESFGYGLSPIESILSVVANILNADNYNSTYFEEGAFPPVILQLIGQVNQRDLESYREYLVSELSGNFHRPAIMATEKAESLQIHNLKDATNKDMQFMEYQDWLAKLCCAAYGMSPQDIGLTDSIGGKNVAEEQSELSEAKGYSSILHLYREVINREIIQKDLGIDDLEFNWVATDHQDPQEASTMYDRDLRNGTVTINEAREARGLAPFGEWADEPMILTGSGYQTLEDTIKDADALADEADKQHELAMQGAKDKGEGDKPKPFGKSMVKAVYTAGGYKCWADDRGYSQPFIYMDIKGGHGKVIKPPVAVNLQSQDLECDLTARLGAMGLNVNPVSKRTFIEVTNDLRSVPELHMNFDRYVNMTAEYDSEKWKAKFGSSRKFSYYLVSDYVDGYSLANPLLIADMKRDPNSYTQAVKDLAALWRAERDLVLGDRRADQYLIGADKRAYGIDYQFEGDVERWEKSQGAVADALKDIPQLHELFQREILVVPEDGVVKSVLKAVRRLYNSK